MLLQNEKLFYICTRYQLFDSKTGEMAEWSNAAVLKTVDCYRSGGSNPSFSATQNLNLLLINLLRFIYCKICTINVRSSLGILF